MGGSRSARNEMPRTTTVFARLEAHDVHRAARALRKSRQQSLARALHVPVTVLTEGPNAAAVVRTRARNMEPARASAVGRDLVETCGDETVTALGDRSDDPTYDDLLSVLDPLIDKWGTRVVAVLLAATADGEFPARDVCARLLDEDPRFALDALGPPREDTIGRPASQEREVSDEEQELKKERRREKRQERAAKKRNSATPRPARYRRRSDAADESPNEAGEGPAIAANRQPRERSVTPLRQVKVVGDFDGVRYDDPLIGAVVVAYIPFHDPDDGHLTGKNRPCIVIAACSRNRLIVRPCYSKGGLQSRRWQSVKVSNPAAAGLASGGSIASREHAVPRARVGNQIGWLAREDWNML